MSKLAMFCSVLLMFGSLLVLVAFTGWKDRRFEAGLEPKPLPEWRIVLICLVPFVVFFASIRIYLM